MESTKWMMLTVTLLGLIAQTDAVCSFPDELRGLWISSYNGPMVFEESSIQGYRTPIPSGEKLSFLCSSRNGSIFTLESSASVPVFGNPVYLFLCMEITQLSDDIFQYRLRSDYENLLKEYVQGHINPDYSYSCTTGSDEELLLVRNVTKTSQMIGTECPSIVQGVYENMTKDISNSNTCYDGFMNCTDSLHLTINVDESCMNDFGVSTFTCLHYSFQSRNHLHVYTWTDNRALWHMSPYGYFCLNISKVGEIISISVNPEACSESYDTVLRLKMIKQTDIRITNVNIEPTKSQLSGSLIVIIVCVVLLGLACAVIFILHVNRKRLSCFRKKDPVYSFDDVAIRS